MLVKTEVDLIEVLEGEVKKINFCNKIFVPEITVKTVYKKRSWRHRKVPKPADKGEPICTFSGIKMFTNVLNDVLKIMSHPEYRNRDIRWVLKKYYPDNKMSTLDTKLCVITRYIRDVYYHIRETSA